MNFSMKTRSQVQIFEPLIEAKNNFQTFSLEEIIEEKTSLCRKTEEKKIGDAIVSHGLMWLFPWYFRNCLWSHAKCERAICNRITSCML